MQIIRDHPYMSATTKLALSTELKEMYVAKDLDMLIVTTEADGPDDPWYGIDLNDPSDDGDETEWSFINDYIEDVYIQMKGE